MEAKGGADGSELRPWRGWALQRTCSRAVSKHRKFSCETFARAVSVSHIIVTAAALSLPAAALSQPAAPSLPRLPSGTHARDARGAKAGGAGKPRSKVRQDSSLSFRGENDPIGVPPDTKSAEPVSPAAEQGQ